MTLVVLEAPTLPASNVDRMKETSFFAPPIVDRTLHGCSGDLVSRPIVGCVGLGMGATWRYKWTILAN